MNAPLQKEEGDFRVREEAVRLSSRRLWIGKHGPEATVVLVLAALGLLVCLFPRTKAVLPAPRDLPVAALVRPGEPILPLPQAPRLDPRKVALGKSMFEEPLLSGSGKVSCSSCHDLGANGALAGKRRTKLDTLTVFNSALSFRYGWTGGDRTLESQVLATLKSPFVAQGASLNTLVDRLRQRPATVAAFQEIYGRPPDLATLVDAIAVFERSLVTPGSRFDRWLGGDSAALTPREAEGYTLFKRLGCVSCHQGANVGGNLLQRHGIFRPLASPYPVILRVPSLRNVATTAPYFHDGSAPTLEIAVSRMASSQLNQDLTEHQIGSIAAFLRTLTGNYAGKPVRQP